MKRIWISLFCFAITCGCSNKKKETVTTNENLKDFVISTPEEDAKKMEKLYKQVLDGKMSAEEFRAILDKKTDEYIVNGKGRDEVSRFLDLTLDVVSKAGESY